MSTSDLLSQLQIRMGYAFRDRALLQQVLAQVRRDVPGVRHDHPHGRSVGGWYVSSRSYGRA